jgi:hypothetical protein
MTTRRLSIVLGAAVAALVLSPVLASADPVPFHDPNVNGKLGFCDKNGHALTTGRITDVPFAFTSVSTVAAPKPYAVPLGKATLYGYSPIQNVDPLNWSPYRMTGSSTYSNKGTPMAQGTPGDAPLEWQVTSFPPTWDGLVQMRLILTAPNQQPMLSPYPAAVLRVTGGTWTMVDGDTSPKCGAGKALSSELVLLPADKRPTAAPSGATTPGVSPSPPASGAASSGSTGSTGTSTASSRDSSTGATLAPTGSDSGATSVASAPASTGTSVLPILLAAVAGAAVMGGGSFWWSRRRGIDQPVGRH